MPSRLEHPHRVRRPEWVGAVATLNWICLVIAAGCLLLTVQTLEARAPAGFIFAFLLLPVQLFGGLLPTVCFVVRHRITGAARRQLLVPAIAGLCLSAASLGTTLLFFEGGC